jgi:hypothetical protein
MEHSFILTLACLKQCWGVTWFCQLEASILVTCFPHGSCICSVYVHSNSHTNTWTETKSPFCHTIQGIYFILSFSVHREIIVPEKSLQKQVQITVHLQNSQPWPSQNKTNPLPNTVIFNTIIPDLKLHPYTA